MSNSATHPLYEASIVVPCDKSMYEFNARHEYEPTPGDVPHKVTLTFKDQLLVFDGVPLEKVHKAILVLGGYVFKQFTPGVGNSYTSHKFLTTLVPRCNDPKREESLNRYRQKKKERCYEKRITYKIRQDVALRIERRRGQFATKNNEELPDSLMEGNQHDTKCMHCGIDSKSTPMMRKGPSGPKTLCNACGLFWVNNGVMRNLSKRVKHYDLYSSESD